MSEGNFTVVIMACAVVLVTLIITIGVLIYQREENKYWEDNDK